MLDKVDQEYNYPVLKVGYFLGRRKQPVTLQSGLKMVADRIKKEKVGSQRWLMFSSLQAFGLLHEGKSSTAPALEKYKQIFMQVAFVKDAKAKTTFLRVLDDFVALTSTRLVVGSNAADSLTNDVLQKAFSAYVRLGSPIEEAPVPWLDAIWRVSDNVNQWTNVVESLEKIRKFPRTLAFTIILRS